MSSGVARLIEDLAALGFESEKMVDSNGAEYAVIPKFTIELGRFEGRMIDLGIPAPDNFPESFGSSIHVRAVPQLETGANIPNVRNIVASALGAEWRYWSHNFGNGERSTRRLMAQINHIFLHV